MSTSVHKSEGGSHTG